MSKTLQNRVNYIKKNGYKSRNILNNYSTKHFDLTITNDGFVLEDKRADEKIIYSAIWKSIKKIAVAFGCNG